VKLAVALLLCALAAPAPADPSANLDMLAFFTGKTHADNVIRIALHRPHKLIVDSIGGRNKEGEFVLIDTVREDGKPVRKRSWVMRPAGTNRFTGSLSDANGPVDVVVSGDGALIRYTMKDGGLKVEQHVELEHDATLSNHVTARKFGLKVASVDGTIRKLD
jgi:Protein of unknown function (DUF3833)